MYVKSLTHVSVLSTEVQRKKISNVGVTAIHLWETCQDGRVPTMNSVCHPLAVEINSFIVDCDPVFCFNKMTQR